VTYWGIAQCHSQREADAAEHLGRKGFECYLPKIKVSAKDRRYRIAPLFPGYCFVRINAIWYPILSTIGVIRLLRDGEKGPPSPINDKIVTDIQSCEVRGIVRIDPPARMKPGDRVRILRGTFKDHIATFDGMNGEQRVRVLLEFLGRKVPVKIHPDDLASLNVAP